jgi:hypothetical protein
MWSSRASMHSRYSIRDEAAQQSESHHQCVTRYWWRYLTNDFQLAGQDGRVVLKRKSVYAGLNHRRPVCDCPSVQPELNSELNAMSDDEFAAIIGAGTASGKPEAEADDERGRSRTCPK